MIAIGIDKEVSLPNTKIIYDIYSAQSDGYI